MLKRLKALSRRPIAAAITAAIIYAVFVYARLAAHGFDPSYFVVAGIKMYDPGSAHASLRSLRDDEGYDGQFYHRLAIEPLTTKRVDHGIRFDAAAYRQQRILYPLLAWMIAMGRPDSVPIALIFVNYIGLISIATLGALLAVGEGRHAMWGLAFSLYPGFIFTISRDLTEIVSATLFLGSLLLARSLYVRGSVASLSLATLARETSLILAASFILRHLRPSRNTGVTRSLVAYYVIPLVLWATWSVYLHSVWGVYPSRQVGIDLPFRSIAELWCWCR